MSAAPQPPALEEFTSAALTVRSGELFNPPGLTNFWGCVQAAFDVVAVQHVTFAPYSCGESTHGVLAVNDIAVRAAGQPIEFIWRPDRIERRASVDGFELASTTVMDVRAQTIAVELRVRNPAASPRTARLSLLTGEGVVRADRGWNTPYSPRECPAISTTPWDGTPPPESLRRNRISPCPEQDGILCESTGSQACLLQVTRPAPDRIEGRRLFFHWDLAPGETRALTYLLLIDSDENSARNDLRRTPEFEPLAARVAQEWRDEIRAAFTPGNQRFSGHLPILETSNTDLRALYLNAAITVLYFKREHPLAKFPRTYATLMPRYWVTTSFLNDWSLTALLLVLLDPVTVREMLYLWLRRGIGQHFGLEYVTGESTGNWYSCNDFAAVRLITTYLRVTGEVALLDELVDGHSLARHLVDATYAFVHRRGPSGLADFGDRNSLLEAVGTYEHEVASLNAANVWMLREVSQLVGGYLGSPLSAEEFRAEADRMVRAVQQLYVPGGHWACRQRDGTLVPVKHVWDFIHTLNFLAADLSPEQIAELVATFEREHRTPHWLAALSPLDEDAGFSLRPDHQWNGSYPGWVAFALGALTKAKRDDLVAAWLPGLARTAAQGPFSQAHFTEGYAPLLAGGARKAPTEWPYINDWTVLCAGAFLDVIVLDLFGVDFGYDQLTARPRLAQLDPRAALHHVRWHGQLHHIAASGQVTVEQPAA
jgi:hypothetical protein